MVWAIVKGPVPARHDDDLPVKRDVDDVVTISASRRKPSTVVEISFARHDHYAREGRCATNRPIFTDTREKRGLLGSIMTWS